MNSIKDIYRLFFCGIIMLLGTSDLFSQRDSIDSYLHAMKEAIADERWSDAGRNTEAILDYHKENSNWDSLIYYNEQLSKIGESSGDLRMQLVGATEASNIRRFFSGNRISAEIESRKIFSLIDTTRLEDDFVSSMYLDQSAYYSKNGKIDSSIMYALRSIRFADKSENPSVRVLSRLHIAPRYKDRYEYGQAIKALLEAEDISDKANIKEITNIRIDMELGRLFLDVDDLDIAKQYLDKAYRRAHKNEFNSFLADVQLFYGMYYEKKEVWDQALHFLNKAQQYYSSKKMNARVANCLVRKVTIWGKKPDHQAFDKGLDSLRSIRKNLTDGMQVFVADNAIARGNLEKAKSILDQLDLKDIPKASTQKSFYHTQYKYYEAKGLSKQALEYFKLYKSLQDSISRSNQKAVSQRIEAEYNRKNQEVKINSLHEVTQEQEKSISLRNRALLGGAVLITALLALFFALLSALRKNEKNQKLLAEQNVEIRKSLERNEVLMKEIHHRVKNNLQVVSSLLSMQERKIVDEDTKDALKSSKSRVQAMSILHQNLYMEENLKDVRADQYLKQLTDNIRETYTLDKNIKIDLQVDPVELDVDVMIPIGLLVNEMVSNAFKHAFVGRDSGHIIVVLRHEEGKIKLRVSDDGVGLANNELPTRNGSLGSRLIHSFTKRLGGDLDIGGTEGTSISIEFDVHNLSNKT